MNVINGQYASPTLTTHLARMLIEVAERRISGMMHLAGADRINRYELAIRFAREFEFNTTAVMPTGPDSANWYARRPEDSSLNVQKATHILNMKPMNLDSELREFKLELPHK